MAWPIQFVVMMLAGLVLGLFSLQFDPRTLSLALPTIGDIETFPISTFGPGLLIGGLLGSLSGLRLHEIAKNLKVWGLRFGASMDIVVLAIVGLAVLVYI